MFQDQSSFFVSIICIVFHPILSFLVFVIVLSCHVTHYILHSTH